MKKLLLTIWLALSCAWWAHATDLHVVMFADTGDGSIGPSVQTDVKTVKSFANEIANALKPHGVSTKVNVYQGRNCSRASLDECIANLDCANDIVLFIYSGHGGRSVNDDAQSKFPRMCLGERYEQGFKKVSDLHSELLAKHPRLAVVVTDCCNSYYDRSRSGKQSAFWNDLGSARDGLVQLFLNNTGLVTITAASPGQYGLCTNDGGYLINGFRESLFDVANSGKNAKWSKVLANTKSDVIGQTGNKQTPTYEDNSRPSQFGNNTNNNNNNINNNTNNNTPHTDTPPTITNNNNNNHTPPTHHQQPTPHRHGPNFSNFIIMMILAVIAFMVPKWLMLEGGIATVLRLVGAALAIGAFCSLF